MDSGFSSLDSSSHEVSSSSPAPVRLCVLCHKPFLRETSYNRHILYCRSAQKRSRTRVRSCRACSIAKAKCSFQPRCLRCATKGLECVYDTAAKTPAATQKSLVIETDEGQPQVHVPISPTSLANGDFTFADLFTSSAAADTDEAHADMDWGDALDFADVDVEMLPPTPKSNMPHLQDPIPKDVIPSVSFFPGISDGRGIVDKLHANMDMESLARTKNPWSTWTAGDEDLPAPAKTTDLLGRPDVDALARLPISDPVLSFTATVLMQMIRAFPQMMLRRDTLPPFIHGHWYRLAGATDLSLPEPLVNCMGIAQIFTSHNPESKPFLWRTIKMEQRSFIEKQDQRQFSKDDLLAAVQAQLIYIIMRVIDNSQFEQDMNLEMLINYQVLCSSFRKLCSEPFCQNERLYPSSSWEDWAFAESRRRTVLVWFLIAQVVRIRTGVPCDAFDDFRSLPLSSPKFLWEARTRATWQTEYEVYKAMPRADLDVFGDLVDACKQSDVAANRLKLDAWNARADQLGMLLGLGASMI